MVSIPIFLVFFENLIPFFKLDSEEESEDEEPEEEPESSRPISGLSGLTVFDQIDENIRYVVERFYKSKLQPTRKDQIKVFRFSNVPFIYFEQRFATAGKPFKETASYVTRKITRQDLPMLDGLFVKVVVVGDGNEDDGQFEIPENHPLIVRGYKPPKHGLHLRLPWIRTVGKMESPIIPTDDEETI